MLPRLEGKERKGMFWAGWGYFVVNFHTNLGYFSPDNYSCCQREKLFFSADLAALDNVYLLLPVKQRVLPEGTADLEGKVIYIIFFGIP